jgi:hypothetical protein
MKLAVAARHNPEEVRRYNTGVTVTGILIVRVAGAPLAEVLRTRVSGPPRTHGRPG